MFNVRKFAVALMALSTLTVTGLAATFYNGVSQGIPNDMALGASGYYSAFRTDEACDQFCLHAPDTDNGIPVIRLCYPCSIDANGNVTWAYQEAVMEFLNTTALPGLPYEVDGMAITAIYQDNNVLSEVSSPTYIIIGYTQLCYDDADLFINAYWICRFQGSPSRGLAPQLSYAEVFRVYSSEGSYAPLFPYAGVQKLGSHYNVILEDEGLYEFFRYTETMTGEQIEPSSPGAPLPAICRLNSTDV